MPQGPRRCGVVGMPAVRPARPTVRREARVNDQARSSMLARLNGPVTTNGHAKAKPAKGARPPRWWGVFAAFVGNHLKNVQPAAACVWCVMFRFSKNRTVTIGYAQIAAMVGISERYAQECVKQLIIAGLVKVESRGNRI